LALSQRQGNTPVPDAYWTDFKSIAHTGEIVGGTSRYIQYRALFSTSMAAFTPVLKDFGITCSASTKGPIPPLSSFTVTKLGMNAQLQWTTPWEQSNKGFEIQRSANDSLHWQTIAFVNGTGTNQTGASYEYLDKNLATGKFYYRIKQTDLAGNYKLSDNIAIVFGNVLLLELRQNYPNPFNGSTTIRFFIPDAGRTQLLLYDQMGRLIRTLTDEIKNTGTYQVTVNKSGLSAGMYYYKLKTKDEEAIRKMTIQ
jgi:Secretion system C-terminal sorting domain